MANTPRLRTRRILVHLEATSPKYPAVSRAIALAKHHRGTLRLVDVLVRLPGHAPGAERIEALADAEARDRLAAAVTVARGQKVPVTTDVLRGEVAEELVAEAVRWKADVVMRSHGVNQGAHGAQGTLVPLGPTDSQLLRRCPCPVWFVTARQAAGERVVVAAVDPDPDDAERQALAVRVVHAAMGVAAETGAVLHLVHAWSAYGHQLVAVHGSDAEAREFVSSSRAFATERMQALRTDARVPDSVRSHLVEGRADVALATFVRSRRASLVVIGTVGRTGLAGLLVGNTAERVLRNVHCSVLALKPLAEVV